MTTVPQTNSNMSSTEEAALAVLERFQPGIRERYARRAALDPAYATTWLNYGAFHFGRDVLDARTRLLVLAGQFTLLRRYERLRETVVAAIREDVDLLEVQEAILQSAIFGGESIVDDALEVFADEAERAGRLADVAARGIRIGQLEERRDQAAERALWSAADAADPRVPGLVEKYGWHGISSALVLRPGEVIDFADFLAGLDADFPHAFFGYVYGEMYGRHVLDDRTRLLCTVGNVLTAADPEHVRAHMKGALRHGAQPREVLEVLFQSVFVVGHIFVPHPFFDLAKILEELGLEL